MKREIEKLGQGVTLNTINTDRFKSTYYSVNFLLPIDRATAAENTLVFRVLNRGCRRYPTTARKTEALQELYDAQIGPVCRQRGEVQIAGVGSDVLDDSCVPGQTSLFADSADFVRQILTEPCLENGVFLPDVVEQEKNNLLDDLRSIINNKTAYASYRLREEMCRDEAYGTSVLGDEASILAATPESLTRRYREILETAPVSVFFAGNTEGLPIPELTRRIFAGIDRRVRPLPTTRVIRRADTVRTVEESAPSSQGKLCMGFRSDCVMGEENYPAAVLMNEMWGGSANSKLFMQVREKQSLCYYCRSSFETLKGVVTVAAGIDNANREVTQREIQNQLEAMKSGDFTDEEIDNAKRSIANSLREADDSPAAQESFYDGRILSGTDDTPETFLRRIGEVTPEQIRAAASRLTPDTVYFLTGLGGGESEEDDNEN